MSALVRQEGNIGGSQQDRRMRRGLLAFTVTMIAGVALVKAGVNPALRLLLVIPFFMAANGLFMALYKT